MGLSFFSWMFHEFFNIAAGILVLIIGLILWFGSAVKLMMLSNQTVWQRNIFMAFLVGFALIFIIMNTLPYVDYNNETAFLVLVVPALLICGSFFFGFKYLANQRRIPVKSAIVDYISHDKTKFPSSNVLVEMVENKTPPGLVKDCRRIMKIYLISPLILLSIVFIFVIYLAFYDNAILNDFIYSGPFFGLIIFIGILSMLFMYLRKNAYDNILRFRRKILVTDKDIQVPVEQSIRGALAMVPFNLPLTTAVAMKMGGYIRYDDLIKVIVNQNEGSIELKTKDYALKLFLSDSDSSKLVSFIEKYRQCRFES